MKLKALCRAALLLSVLLALPVRAGSFDPDKESKTAYKGPYPWQYQALVMEHIQEHFFDPEGVKVEIFKPIPGWIRKPGIGKRRQRTTYCWQVGFYVNGKNRLGGYVGYKLYSLGVKNGHSLGSWAMTSWTREYMQNLGEKTFEEELAKLSESQRAEVLLLDQPAPSLTTPPAAETASSEPAYITELRELAKLRDDGVLTEAEFNAKKAEILARQDN